MSINKNPEHHSPINPGRPIQAAAIPYRIDRKGRLKFLLVTSRTNRRWIIPKGRIHRFLGAARSAAREAYEEAGVRGKIADDPVARYRQLKLISSDMMMPMLVEAFPLCVEEELPSWPEQGQRTRRWVTAKAMRKLVRDKAIRRMLLDFAKAFR